MILHIISSLFQVFLRIRSRFVPKENIILTIPDTLRILFLEHRVRKNNIPIIN